MKRVSVFMAAIMVFVASTGISLAFNPSPVQKATRSNISEKLKLETPEERCARITKKIENKTTGFDENKDRHYNAYKNLDDRLTKLSAKLKAKGYDVTELDADRVVLDEKISKFLTDYTAYMAKLGETKDYACGHSDGEFKGKLAEARALLKTVREDSQDIKNYFLNTIRPDIKKIRDQKPTTENGGSDTE